MSEAVALNKKIQSRFVKKVKNMKDKVGKGVVIVKENIMKQKQKRKRGLIYLGHIPHGFYEDEMRNYFQQFGDVTNVRVNRSRKTGHSKGYGFVEFREPDVAQIAAETMDNYLMFNRRLICKYIPPEKQHKSLFRTKQWSEKSYPLKMARKIHIKKRNKNPGENIAVTSKKMLNNIKKKIDKLTALGINHTFIPSDVPDDMTHLLQNKDIQKVNSDNNVRSSVETNGEIIQKSRSILKNKSKQKPSFKIQKARNLCKEFKSKSLKTIKKKKEKLQNTMPKISFMQNERLKRLAAAQIRNETIVKKVNKLKKVINQ